MSLLDELLAKAGTTREAWNAAREEMRAVVADRRANEEAARVAFRHTPMTGRDLLKALLALSDEDLAKKISTEGCDCYGDVGEVVVDGEIELRRT